MTNILVLAFQLIWATPTNNFTVYSDWMDYPTSDTSRYACITGVLTFDGPPGIYEVRWSTDAESFFTTSSSRGHCRVNDRVVHTTEGPQTIVMPVPNWWTGFYRMKLAYRL